MTGDADHLQWRAVVAALNERLATAVAREQLGTAAASASEADWPLADGPEVARVWLDEIDGLEAALEHASGSAGFRLRQTLAQVGDLRQPLQEAAAGSALDLPTLVAVGDLLQALSVAARLCQAAGEVAEDDATRRVGCDALRHALVDVVAMPALRDQLQRAIDREGPDGVPILRDTASPELATARRQLRSIRGELTRHADAIVRGGGLGDALADRFWTEREGRIVLPIRASALPHSSVASGIIHDASSRGHTLFVEPPALVEDNNRLRRAQVHERAEVRRVIEALSRAVGQACDALARGLAALARLDVVAARLALSRDLNGARPEVVEATPSATLRLPGARHPLMVLAGSHVVPNTIEIAIGQILVVSGPNAGGKTVTLKTVGLCVGLARAGVRVPTEAGAVIPLFRDVVTDVGDDQSIARNLSTFSAHIGHVQRALQAAFADGPGTLVLLDEVAVGTDPQQGAALAEAVLCALVESGASGIVTTHYERLKLLAAHDPRFVNAAVGFDLEALAPTFELRVGVPGSSSAIAVARRLGLPAHVLEAAEAILDDDGRKVDVLLAQIEAERTRLQETRTRLAAESSEMARERARLSARDQRELEASEQRRAKAHREAASELHRLEDELKRRRKRLAEVADDDEARRVTRQARDALGRAAQPLVPDVAEPPATLAVGDRVRLGDLKSVGHVVSIKGDKVTVQLAHAKVTVPRARLASGPAPAPTPVVARPAAAPSQAGRHFGAHAQPFDPSLDDIEDLRGYREDEAITRLEVFLDRAIAADREVVVVRHGHGSGALRKVVRDTLPRLPAVVAHRPGLPAEGGDAVTVVWVRA